MDNKLDFNPAEMFDENIDSEEVVHFDLDAVEDEAKQDAIAMVDNLAKFYYNENFMKSHPSFAKRVETDIESLRVVIKLRKADELVQNQLIKSIASNTNNASLYKALADIQKVIISLTTKINELVNGLNNLMRGYQQELDFDGSAGQDREERDDGEIEESEDITMRGAKDFIRQMRKEMGP